MAPGGFSTVVRKRVPKSTIDAITLPLGVGGYEVMAKNVCETIIFADITMCAREMALDEEIPIGHPDAKRFDIHRHFSSHQYDLVFCGGGVGKNHPRKEYRSDGSIEWYRLITSQLVFGLNRLKPRGSLVVLLHRPESWDTTCILYAFNQFSDIQLYKHPESHGLTSSFYLVAKNIKKDHDALPHYLSYRTSLWKHFTFKDFSDDHSSPPSRPDSAFVHKVRDEFGPHFLELARPVWKVKSRALREASFTK